MPRRPQQAAEKTTATDNVETITAPPPMVGKPSDGTAQSRKSACINADCRSTEREPYENRQELECGGTNADGSPYTHVVWANTVCRRCGQRRRDRWTEHRPETELS